MLSKIKRIESIRQIIYFLASGDSITNKIDDEQLLITNEGKKNNPYRSLHLLFIITSSSKNRFIIESYAI